MQGNGIEQRHLYLNESLQELTQRMLKMNFNVLIPNHFFKSNVNKVYRNLLFSVLYLDISILNSFPLTLK